MRALPTDNPFEPLAAHRLATVFQWPEQALRFASGHGDCLHVLGACGMGKTAVLCMLQAAFAAQGVDASYLTVPLDDASAVQPPPVARVVLLDEADRLSLPAFRDAVTFLRGQGCRLAVSAHRSRLAPLRRAGYDCLRLRLRRVRDLAVVERLLHDRIALAVGSADHPFSLSAETCAAFRRASRGNVERILHLGYEVFEDLKRPRAIAPDDVARAAAALDGALGSR